LGVGQSPHTQPPTYPLYKEKKYTFRGGGKLKFFMYFCFIVSHHKVIVDNFIILWITMWITITKMGAYLKN